MLRTVNNYYLIYEYCNGGTLTQILEKRRFLKEAEALKIFAQMVEAFKVLVKENILHRDLKPSNILFHDGVLKLADFGFCKELLKENDMTQTMVGSPIYMAPEVLKGQTYNCKADIWSMGVVLYEMLFGVCPYE
jgi:serine/threonine protein kinase